MKLLIITQVVDIDDSVLGFMHNWLEELAKRYKKLTVICLKKGKVNLPDNVKILSLGKEKSQSRIKYILNFYKYIWQTRKEYNKVLVHMNKEYVLLGGLFWRLGNKKTHLWYNHVKGNFLSTIAGLLSNRIFFTSPFSYFSKWKKARQMPVGINTEIFKKNDNIQKNNNSILCLGRISPIKNVDVLIKAVELLDETGAEFKLSIVGEPGENDDIYFQKIKEMSSELEKKGKIEFLGKVENYKTPERYNRSEIYVNMTNSGSLDKTTLEAMACGSLALVCNKSFENIFPEDWHEYLIFEENNEQDLADKITQLIKLAKEKKASIMRKSREIVSKRHNLDKLIKEIDNSLREL